MCSGTGRCVTPVIEVRNEMTDMEGEFRVYTENCTADNALSVNMYGASPWGRVNDSLHTHGLCSHRNWWEYNRTLSFSTSGSNGACNRLSGVDGDWCELNTGLSAHRWRFTKNQEKLAKGGLFDQRVLWQEPHTCDRDYSHFDGYKSCSGSPGWTWWKSLDGGTNASIIYPNSLLKSTTYLNTSWLFRTYRLYPDSSIRTRIGIMKHVTNHMFGFLGVRAGSPLSYNTYEDYSFKKCSSIRSCTPQPFYLYGYLIQERRFRKIGSPMNGEIRPKITTFTCGAYGYYDTVSQKCVLDLGTAPFYRVMCYNQLTRATIFSSCQSSLILNAESDFMTEYCYKFLGTALIQTVNGRSYQFDGPTTWSNGHLPIWTPNIESKRLGIPVLINRFTTDAFRAVKSFASSSRPNTQLYLDTLQCVQSIQTAMASEAAGTVQYTFPIDPEEPTTSEKRTVISGQSLYRFSDYGMYEFPFSWFAKCSLLVGRFPNDEAVNCPEWSTSFDVGSDTLSTTTTSTGGVSGGGTIDLWWYLTRINGGFWEQDPVAKIASLTSQWQNLVDSKATPINFAKYFKMYSGTDFNPLPATSLLDFRRYCAYRREVIKHYFDQSSDMQTEYLNKMNDADPVWPTLDGEYRDIGGAYLCTGIGGACEEGKAICGCTQVNLLHFLLFWCMFQLISLFIQVYSEWKDTQIVDTSPLTVAKEYVRVGGSLANPVTRVVDFLQNDALQKKIKLQGMQVPTYKYMGTNKPVDGDYIDVRDGIGRNLISDLGLADGPLRKQNFQDPMTENCTLTRINDPEFANQMVCFTGSKPDALIATAEAAWPGGITALELSRSRTSHMIFAMGTNAGNKNWLTGTTDDGFSPLIAKRVYDNQLTVGTGKYFQGVSTYTPNFGTMVLDLYNTQYVDTKLRDNYYVQNDNRGPGTIVDSFCGLVNAGLYGSSITRRDTCGVDTAQFLQECDAPAPLNQAKWFSTLDVHHQQTCIHDHTCTLSLMTGTDKDYNQYVFAFGKLGLLF